jgi:hypothetical protein
MISHSLFFRAHLVRCFSRLAFLFSAFGLLIGPGVLIGSGVFAQEFVRPVNPLSLELVQTDNSSGGAALNGFITNDLLLDTEDQILSFQMRLELEQGWIFQDSFGGNTAPAEGLAELGFLSLAFDTFVAVGAETAGGPYGTPGIAGGAVDFGSSPQVEFDDDTLSITWYGTPGMPMYGFEDYLLSRISMSEDAIGDWDLSVGMAIGAYITSGTVENGLLVQSLDDLSDETLPDDIVTETNMDVTIEDIAVPEDLPVTENNATHEAGSELVLLPQVVLFQNDERVYYIDSLSGGIALSGGIDYFNLPVSFNGPLDTESKANIPEPCTGVLAFSTLWLLLLRRNTSPSSWFLPKLRATNC